MASFKQYLITEQSTFLGQKIGDILSALHSLEEDGTNVGNRNLIRFCEEIASQIRRILHSHWEKEANKHLLVLQKCAFNLLKGIDDKEDLHGIVVSVKQEIEKLLKNIGEPINNLNS
jgi:predicted ABC-class ATPase